MLRTGGPAAAGALLGPWRSALGPGWLHVAGQGDLAKLGHLGLASGGRDPYSRPGQREAVGGGTDREQWGPDRQRGARGEHRGDNYRGDQQGDAEQSADGGRHPAGPVARRGGVDGGADPFGHWVGAVDREDVAQGQRGAEGGQGDRHGLEPEGRGPGGGAQAEGQRGEQRYPDHGEDDVLAGEVGAQRVAVGQRGGLHNEGRAG